MKYIYLILLLISFELRSQSPIKPKDVFSEVEIDEIIKKKNFFLYKNLDEKRPVWMKTSRKYSSHFLGQRDHYLNLNDFLNRSITDGLAVKYSLMQLYRSKLKVHKRIGDILPHLRIHFGQANPVVWADNLFGGVFSFMHPANWMKLKNEKRVYKISKLMLMKVFLDQILDAHLLYLDMHQLITEFEILNYYFIHLQIFAETFHLQDRFLATINGKFAFEGTKMASKRGDTKLGFNKLANYIALEQIDGDLTVNSLNIADIVDFPSKVKGLDKLENIYRDKELFVKEVLKKSIELKISKEFFKISKLNIGVTAFGESFSYLDRPFNTNNEANFAFTLGYGTLPEVLISKSFAKTAKLDVKNEFINLLNIARKSFDMYTNSIGGYTEAKRALKINREALIKNLNFFVNENKAPDALFILALNNLIGAEFKLNNALHGSLRARCLMDRFLLKSDIQLNHHFPKKDEILSIFNQFKNTNTLLLEKEKIIDHSLRNINHHSHLKNILYDFKSLEKLKNFTEEDLLEGVKRNISNLLSSSWKQRKHKKFYKILASYVEKHHIELNISDQEYLKKKLKK